MSDDDASTGPRRSTSESRFLREYLEAQERAAQAARERQAAEDQRREQIDQANREIEIQRLSGTLEPVPLEKADEGIKRQYELKREDVRKAIEEGYRKEVELTLGDIKADASTTAYIDQIKLEIAEKWAREEAKRLEELERQEIELRAKERRAYDLDR